MGVIRVIEEENLIENGRRFGERLVSGLEMVKERTGLIREIRARGSMIGLELVDDGETSRTIRVHRKLVRRGYVLGRRSGFCVLRIDPALTIDLEDIEGFLETFEAVLHEVGRSDPE